MTRFRYPPAPPPVEHKVEDASLAAGWGRAGRWLAPLPPGERQAVERALDELAPMVVELVRDRRRRMHEALVQEFVAGVAPTPIDIRRERLHAKALQAIYRGTQWMTAAELSELAGAGIATVHRWKTQGKIFAIQHGGKDMFPRYALGMDFKPLPVVADVIAVFEHKTPVTTAAWFESASGALGGRRPRELVARDPAAVLAAAKDEVQAEADAG